MPNESKPTLFARITDLIVDIQAASQEERKEIRKAVVDVQNNLLVMARETIDNQPKHFELICQYRSYVMMENILYHLDILDS